MIVKMAKATIIVAKPHIDDALAKLRKFGLLHIKHINSPSGERVSHLEKDLEDARRALSLFETKAQYEGVSLEAAGLMIKDALHIFDSRRRLIIQGDDLKQKLQWFREWGKVSYKQIEDLNESGIFIRLYIVNRVELKTIPKDKLIFVLKREKGKLYIALVSKEKSEKLDFKESIFPEKDFVSLGREMAMVERWILDIDANIEELSKYKSSFEKYKISVAGQLEFYKVRGGMGKEKEFWYLQGFLPDEDTARLKRLSDKEGWGMLVDEPDNPDEVPTLIRNPKWVSIIDPVFKFMGTVPGYAEYDISIWFLLFLTFFFAVLIGDAGYGMIFLLLTFFAQRKLKHIAPESFHLIYVFSIATIVWGVCSGTYFGAEQIARLPVFNALIVEKINSFAAGNQKFMIYLCFLTGAIHLTIAHSIIARRPRGSFTVFAQAGWIAIIWGLFFLAGTLVLAMPFPHIGKYLLIIGISIVMIFSHPQRNILKAIANSLIDIPLKLIGSFADIVSYIRLFAVGYATVVVASSFNNMALSFGFNSFVRGFGSTLVLFIGHFLNIILGIMAIIVHGVRLNMLEFSSHLGMEWSGKEYAPFRE